MLFNLLNFFSNVPAPDRIWNDSVRTAFTIGSLKVEWYSIFVLLGFVFAILLSCMKLWKWYKIPVEPFYWFILIGVPLAIFGARFWSCCLGDASWKDFWNFAGGGLAIQGGVVFVVTAAFIYLPLVLRASKYKIRLQLNEQPVLAKVSIWMYFDAVVPTILIGQVIGRWGNYFNQELYGAVVTNDALKWFLHNHLPYLYVNGIYYQPLFLWEGLFNFAGLLLLYVGAEFIPHRKAGDLGAAYFTWYGTLRLCLEPLRSGDFTFASTYVMSGLFVAFGIILIVLNHTLSKKWRNIKIWDSLKTWQIVKRPQNDVIYYGEK